MILMGKHRPTYTPHVDTGDFVIVINAEKVIFSDPKSGTRNATTGTRGYPGLRMKRPPHARSASRRRSFREAVRRMLPKNKLAFKMIEKLKIYCGSEHPHQAQQPEPKELGIK